MLPHHCHKSVLFAIGAALSLFLSWSDLHAEGTSQPGPQAANFKMQNNGSGIDSYTGSFNWKQRLITVPGRGGLDFPVDLTYHSGIGCEQEASWVGLGFGLNLGSIERSVVFLPDDMLLYAKFNYPYGPHQFDGWLFDDNYKYGMADSNHIDGPDMWTVAINELGANLSIVADSSNIFTSGSDKIGPAGELRWSVNYQSMSSHQRHRGLAVRIGNSNYPPDGSLQSGIFELESQRQCYVSPRMDTCEYVGTQSEICYDYDGEIQLVFNDDVGAFGDNGGQCKVLVYKMPSGSGSWAVPETVTVNGYSSWTSTGVSVAAGDRFALFVQTRKFEFEKWNAWRVSYEVEFANWDGYYKNPEIYSNPYDVMHQGYTPRVKSFTLTSPGGTVYKFDKFDYVKATSRHELGVTYDNVSIAYASSFKLTSILSSDYVDADADGIPSNGDYGSWVKIVYESAPTRINYANKGLKALDATFRRFGSSDYSAWQWHYIHYPAYVETPTHKLQFHLSPRSDNLGIYGPTSPADMRPKKLDSLSLNLKRTEGDLLIRKIVMDYAPATVRPTSFGQWNEGEVLAWHKYSYSPYSGGAGDFDSTGKLTLLQVRERGAQDEVLPTLKFSYETNPRYDEQLNDGMPPNEKVDYYYSQLGDDTYYGSNYKESWGYYRTAFHAKPGDDQRAWSTKEILYPSGAKESLVWESNRYKWTNSSEDMPTGTDVINYSPGSYNPDEAERGGIRLKWRRLDGGMGTDSGWAYSYGEGVATKPQCPAKKAFYTGFLGNSQEVGYRSSAVRPMSDPVNARTATYYTNGSVVSGSCQTNYFGQSPQPAVTPAESFPDRLETNCNTNTHVILEGVKRGLPYAQETFNSAGGKIAEEATTYDFEVKAAFDVDMPYDQTRYVYMPDMKARSIWIKTTQRQTWTYDEEGNNPVLQTVAFAYDPINGLVAEQSDAASSSEQRKLINRYLHTEDPTLTDILAEKNMLNLIRSTELRREGGKSGLELSKTAYDYKDFGNGRIYLWHKTEYRDIVSSDILTTTYESYDNYGNPTLIIDPAGTKTTFRWGYAGTRKILEAPNADTGEVTYNGFEDSLTFDGWQHHDEVLSSASAFTYTYSGSYSAKVTKSGSSASFGPSRLILETKLVRGKRYVFSGWVYTTGSARLNVDIRHYGSAPDYGTSAASGSWQRIEVVFQYPTTGDTVEFYTACDAGTAYFDDLRIHPADCPMQTFAYDHAAGQLQAAFDANNFASERLHYDGLGRLSYITNPEDMTTSNYAYYYSRTYNPDGFDPSHPNQVRTYRFLGDWPDVTAEAVCSDGLGREIQRITWPGSEYASSTVSATFYDPTGQQAASSKTIDHAFSVVPTFLSNFVPSGWVVGDALTSGHLRDYYDGNPGPDCQGYPYTQYVYSNDPLRRVKEVGYPGITWKVGNNKTTRYSYWSNEAGDCTGWSAYQLFKTKTLDEGGLATYQYADKLGRVRQIQVDSTSTGPSFKTTFKYDVAGNLTQSNRQRSETDVDSTMYEYDNLGQLIYQKSADAGGVRYLYDKNGNLRFVKDSLSAFSGSFVYYKYDQLGRKIAEGTIGSTYFTQANADLESFPTSGARFIFRYDSLGLAYSRGRLSSWQDQDLSNPNWRKLKYDNQGRVIQEEVKVDDSVTVLNYTYDLLGNLKTFGIGNSPVFPTVHYSYGNANRLTGVGSSSGGTQYANMTYWPDGMVHAQALRNPNGGTESQHIDYAYNPRGWLLGINDVGAMGGDRFGEAIDYGTSYNGNIDSTTSNHYGQSNTGERFKYDRLHRLWGWVYHEGTNLINDSMYYDRAGNFTFWKRVTSPPLVTVSNTYTYVTGTNRLQKIGGAYDNAYDRNGNLIWEPNRTFEQEYRNIASKIIAPQSAATDTLIFVYDADLRRVKKSFVYGWNCQTRLQKGFRGSTGEAGSADSSTQKGGQSLSTGDDPIGDPIPDPDPDPEPEPDPNQICWSKTTTQYIYTYDGRVVREYRNGYVQRDYLYAGAQRIGVSSWIGSGSTYKLCYYLNDHLGSTRALVDSTGVVVAKYDYYPYGGLRASTVSTDTKVRFTGKYYDGEDVSQYYFGARYLNGLTNRFNSVDPAAGKYPGWSPYAYAYCNPARVVDPNGLYGADVHYDLNYYMAVKVMGASEVEATAIAMACQAVDDNLSTSPQSPFNWNNNTSRHFESVASSAQMASLLTNPGGLSSGQFGEALHSLQDPEFAHKGYKAWGGKGVLGHATDPKEPDRVGQKGNRGKMKPQVRQMIAKVYEIMKARMGGKAKISLEELLEILDEYLENHPEVGFEDIQALVGGKPRQKEQPPQSPFFEEGLSPREKWQMKWDTRWSPAAR